MITSPTPAFSVLAFSFLAFVLDAFGPSTPLCFNHPVMSFLIRRTNESATLAVTRSRDMRSVDR